MKASSFLYFVLIFSLTISGCGLGSPASLPTQVEQHPSPTVARSTPTLTPSPFTSTPIKTATLTPPATLEPEKAKETIEALLKAPVDCSAPCFWGITPGQTAFGEAENIFDHLGLRIASPTSNGEGFSGVTYDFDSGLSIYVILAIENDIVKNLSLNISPEKQKKGVPREWLAYSPETLIKRYGPPSRVDFAIAWGPGPSSLFVMVMYFDIVDLIVEYDGQDIIPWQQKGSPQVCPLVAQYEIARFWMGKDPVYPPPATVPLEDASGMTIEEFSKLMTGNPDKACFKLKGEMFP